VVVILLLVVDGWFGEEGALGGVVDTDVVMGM